MVSYMISHPSSLIYLAQDDANFFRNTKKKVTASFLVNRAAVLVGLLDTLFLLPQERTKYRIGILRAYGFIIEDEAKSVHLQTW